MLRTSVSYHKEQGWETNESKVEVRKLNCSLYMWAFDRVALCFHGIFTEKIYQRAEQRSWARSVAPKTSGVKCL